MCRILNLHMTNGNFEGLDFVGTTTGDVWCGGIHLLNIEKHFF